MWRWPHYLIVVPETREGIIFLKVAVTLFCFLWKDNKMTRTLKLCESEATHYS
jgi:hypothetical protein